MLSYLLQLAISALHLNRGAVDEGWFSVMVAVQHVLMWAKLQYFARCGRVVVVVVARCVYVCVC